MFRVVNLVMAILFAISAALQYNDPDPIQWFLIYAAAAVVSGMVALRRRFPSVLPIVVGLVAVVWSVWIMTHMHGGFAWHQLAEEMHASTPTIEESRESLGLLIVAVWMFVVALGRKRP
jgi:hypothetical protein